MYPHKLISTSALIRGTLGYVCCSVCLVCELHYNETLYLLQLRIMDELILSDPEAASWLEAQQERSGRLHLLAGDSIARDSGLESRLQKDRIYNCAVGGATWSRLISDLPSILARWDKAAALSGREKGDVIVWLTGNEVYPRYSAAGRIDSAQLDTIAQSVHRAASLLQAGNKRLVVLGPLPRFEYEIPERPWETSAAYHLERTIKRALPESAQFVPLGRLLAKRMGRRIVFGRDCQVWYRPDGVHLSRAGYDKLMESALLPIWMKM